VRGGEIKCITAVSFEEWRNDVNIIMYRDIILSNILLQYFTQTILHDSKQHRELTTVADCCE
jgi:hypothetical protein